MYVDYFMMRSSRLKAESFSVLAGLCRVCVVKCLTHRPAEKASQSLLGCVGVVKCVTDRPAQKAFQSLLGCVKFV